MKSANTDPPTDGVSRADRLVLKSLSTRSDRRGVMHLVGHGLLIAMAAVGVAQVGWVFQPVLGIALVFLFAPLHETIHRTAFASRWLNDLVSLLTGAVLILPPRYFRAFHLEHHRHTQIPGKDPELPGKEITTVGGYLIHITGIPYWWAAISGLVQRAGGRLDAPYLQGQAAAGIVTESRLYLVFYAGVAVLSVWTGSDAAVTYWLVPVLLGQPFLRLYLLAEHKLCPLVPDMFENTRTTLTHPLIRWLAWNMTYHTEHHAFMAVPFHQLPAAHRHFRDRLRVVSPGYVDFHRRYLQALRSRAA